MTLVCGVDGCRDGWVVVWHDLSEGRMWWEVVPDVTSLATRNPAASVSGIDVPIGLVDRGPRACDLEARRLLGFPRSASVFPAPIRPLLDADSYATASAIRRRREGKGLSVQAWGIVPKVREVDEALRVDVAFVERVYEVHPELSFMFMNGERALEHGKKSPAGREARIELVRAEFGDEVDRALRSRPSGCAEDDLLDAFAAAWTATRIAAGRALTIPELVPRDRYGLPMRMVM
jgi:predicted RNase H-like nuclease